MIKQLLQLESRVEDWISQWHIPVNLPIDKAEQMLLQYLQYLAKVKEQQAAAQAAVTSEAPPAPPVESDKIVPLEQPQPE